MPKQVMVNVHSVLNAGSVRHETRNGRKVMVVSSATLPDNIVMNGIKYPADEIEKSYGSLEGTLAPLGHPKLNDRFVSAKDPSGLAQGYIGAHNENVRREQGRVLVDKVIDIEVANSLEGGRRVLAAINKGDPVHTSTGLLCKLEPVENATDHKNIARDIVFDHDAILLDEEGAATPDKGVGMMVNSQGEEIEVINSNPEDDELDWALDMAARALDRKQRRPLLERMKEALMSVIEGDQEPSQSEEHNMAIKDEDFQALVNSVATLGTTMATMAESITALNGKVEPMAETLNSLTEAQKQAADAEKADLVNKVVEADLLDEDTAKTLTNAALTKMVEKLKPADRRPAAALVGNRGTKQAATSGFALPKGE